MRIVILALTLAVVSPASADTPAEQLNIWREVTFTAPIPCSVVCPYWLDVANTDVDGNGEEDIAFGVCANPRGAADTLGESGGLPYEEGTIYDDELIGPPPEGSTVLLFEIWPTIDWDAFICSTSDNELTIGEHILVENCDSIVGPNNPVPIGCRERISASAVPGREYILRAYNWSDPLPLEGRYCFSSQGSCAEAGG